MLCEIRTDADEYHPWKPKIKNNNQYHNISGAPPPSVHPQTSSEQYPPGADIVPDISFKTSGSSDAKSITPEKDHDVIMDEADEGAAAASGSGGDNARVAIESGGGDGEEDDDSAASDGENSNSSDKSDKEAMEADKSDKDVADESDDSDDEETDAGKDEAKEDPDYSEAEGKGDSSESETEGGARAKTEGKTEEAKGKDKGEDSEEASPKPSPMDKLMEAVDKDDKPRLVSGEAGADAAKEANKDAGEGKKSDTTKSAGDEEKTKSESEGETVEKNGNGKEEKSEDPSEGSGGKSEPEKDSEKNPEGEKNDEPPAPEANLPLLVGTLAYSDRDNLRRHIIRGNWKYENSHVAPPQRFELLRTIPPEEDLKELPKDGEFNGSFNVQHTVKTSKGKFKMKNSSVPESGVKLTFKEKGEEEGVFEVKGTGTNMYGTFELFGTATKNTGEDVGEDPTYSISVHKKYVAPPPAPPAAEGKSKDKKRKHAGDADDEPKPPPTELPSEGICLKGKLARNTSDELSLDNTAVHRITGLWAMSPAKLTDEPGACERFEYEHKCSGDSTVFPLSGRYTGFFYVSDHGTKSKITERDATLKFRMNSEGFWNVEGKGSNIYGKFNIMGTLTKEGDITLFRVYQALKLKASKKSTHVKISAPGANGSTKSSSSKAEAVASTPAMQMFSFVDVNLPSEDIPAPLNPPEQFSATSRGILKIENDGTHTCQGSWALTNEHFQGGITSKYHFGLTAHEAAEDAKVMLDKLKSSGLDEDDDRKVKVASDGLNPSTLANSTFPIDSTRYRGNFKLKKGTRNQTVADQQLVLKFVKNSGGSYNVYGKGTNEMGIFDLVGTLILQGKSHDGLMQLYRSYAVPPLEPVSTAAKKNSSVFRDELAPVVHGGLQRQSVEDAPQAQVGSYDMERCRQILKELQDSDPQNIFAAPVDPIALSVPQYFDVITNPMDLGTIQRKLDKNEVDSPEEFARLVRLTFQNAITFNTLPDNPAHVLARHLLGIFNKKFSLMLKAEALNKSNHNILKAKKSGPLKKRKDAPPAAAAKAKSKDKKRKHGEDAADEPKLLIAAGSASAAASSAKGADGPGARKSSSNRHEEATSDSDVTVKTKNAAKPPFTVLTEKEKKEKENKKTGVDSPPKHVSTQSKTTSSYLVDKDANAIEAVKTSMNCDKVACAKRDKKTPEDDEMNAPKPVNPEVTPAEESSKKQKPKPSDQPKSIMPATDKRQGSHPPAVGFANAENETKNVDSAAGKNEEQLRLKPRRATLQEQQAHSLLLHNDSSSMTKEGPALRNEEEMHHPKDQLKTQNEGSAGKAQAKNAQDSFEEGIKPPAGPPSPVDTPRMGDRTSDNSHDSETEDSAEKKEKSQPSPRGTNPEKANHDCAGKKSEIHTEPKTASQKHREVQGKNTSAGEDLVVGNQDGQDSDSQSRVADATKPPRTVDTKTPEGQSVQHSHGSDSVFIEDESDTCWFQVVLSNNKFDPKIPLPRPAEQYTFKDIRDRIPKDLELDFGWKFLVRNENGDDESVIYADQEKEFPLGWKSFGLFDQGSDGSYWNPHRVFTEKTN